MCICWGTQKQQKNLQNVHVLLDLNQKFDSHIFSPCGFSDWLIDQDKRQEGEAWFRTVGLLKLGPGRRDDALWRKVQGTVGGEKGVCLQTELHHKEACHKQRHTV